MKMKLNFINENKCPKSANREGCADNLFLPIRITEKTWFTINN